MIELRDVVPTCSIPTAFYDVLVHRLWGLPRLLVIGLLPDSLPPHGRSPFRSWLLVALSIASSFIYFSIFIPL